MDDYHQYRACVRPKTLEWLSARGPSDWHRLVMDLNWDHGSHSLLWIVSQDECDAGTAQYIFWLAEPGYYADDKLADRDRGEHFQREDYELIQEIARRWVAGRYPTWNHHVFLQVRSRIEQSGVQAGDRINSELTIPSGIDRPAKGESLEAQAPPSLDEILEAVERNSDLTEGVPNEVSEACQIYWPGN
ncbi:MAG: DUF4274 domain-containing protein [Pseudomonadota bacterium]